MNATPDAPNGSQSELTLDDEAFDDFARRAGAALRRPAPADGLRVIADRRRRHQALKVTAVGGVVVASLIGALAVFAVRDDPDRPPSIDTPAEMVPTTPPTTTDPVAPSPTSAEPAPGEEITVTADRIEFGDALVGLVTNVARGDGRTFVVAGRYRTETDLFFPPDEAVLAGFDAGREMWRTELDGSPREVVTVGDTVWVMHGNGRVSGFDPSDGRLVGDAAVTNGHSMIGAFDSSWVVTMEYDATPDAHAVQLVRIGADLSTSTVDLAPDGIGGEGEFVIRAAAGAGAIWVPMGAEGVAVVDPDTLETSTISSEEIGHEVRHVAVENDVVYVASSDRVTSIVDGVVRATASTGAIMYLGSVDGTFGVMSSEARFTVLTATDPMVVEIRDATRVATVEIDGQAWGEEGRNYDIVRAELSGGPSGTSPPETTAGQPDPPSPAEPT